MGTRDACLWEKKATIRLEEESSFIDSENRGEPLSAAFYQLLVP
jgi:hypothetical protein